MSSLCVTAQHTTCSNISLVLPKHVEKFLKNKHLTVASRWFSLLLHNLLTMHGHRNLKFNYTVTVRKLKRCLGMIENYMDCTLFIGE